MGVVEKLYHSLVDRYAVVASGCASCPKLRCERPGCGSYFCYHCKAAWHPNQTCDSARAERSANMRSSTFRRDSQSSKSLKTFSSRSGTYERALPAATFSPNLQKREMAREFWVGC